VECVRKLKKARFKLVAISTGLQFMADRARKELGFDYAVSNKLLSYKGKLTGGVHINLEHGAKHRILHQIFKRFGVKPSETISVGDSEGDIPLAKECGYSIAFNSSSKELSMVVDYSCKTRDFEEVYRQILSINNKQTSY
jgi:phosphoserine phosphatase